MSNALMFDRYRVIKKYREAGLTEDQAELYAEALVIAVEDQVATKQDVQAARNDLGKEIQAVRQEIAEVRSELKQDIAEVRQDMLSMENRLLLRLGVLVAGSVAASTAVLGLLITLV